LKSSFSFFFVAEIKHRSSSLDHSSNIHRRHSQKRKTAPIRAPYVVYFSNIIEKNISSFSESDDEQIHLPMALGDLNTDKMKQNNKLVL